MKTSPLINWFVHFLVSRFLYPFNFSFDNIISNQMIRAFAKSLFPFQIFDLPSGSPRRFDKHAMYSINVIIFVVDNILMMLMMMMMMTIFNQHHQHHRHRWQCCGDHHRNPNIKDRAHLVGQLTTCYMYKISNIVFKICCKF